MKKLLLAVLLGVVIATVSFAQPAITSVVNGSSYAADVARGSWFVVFGSGMGPASLALYAGSLPFPTSYSGTSVTFTPAAGGTAVNCLIWYTSAGQLAALLPSSTTSGSYNVRVAYNGQTSAPKQVNVVDRNFGFATQASNGAGPAQATYGGLDLNRFTTGTIGAYTTRPAKPGDAMVLWGTGLGADTASDLNGGTSGDVTQAAQVKVLVGGLAVTPAYAGRSSGAPGLDQINFTVPSTTTPNCFVGIQVQAGGRTSNLGTIAVVSPGASACATPFLSTAELARLDVGGSVVIGDFSLSKTSSALSVPGLGSFTESNETAEGAFSKYGVDTIGNADFSLLQIGSCEVLQRTGTQDQIEFGVAPQPLDAGAQLTLNGPNASNKAIPRQSDKSYNLALYSSGIAGVGATGSPTLTTGTYTISGTGGADIGAFTVSITAPGNFSWTNQSSVPSTVPRSSPLTITWTGGAGLVSVEGSALVAANGISTTSIYNATFFTCTAQASAGSLTVPVSVLQQLPAVANNALAGTVGLLTVITLPDASTGQGSFTAPLTAGGSIDMGRLVDTVGSSISVGWN